MVDIKFPIMRRRKLAALGSVIALECALSQFQKAARAVIREAFVIRPLILEPQSNGRCPTRRIVAGALSQKIASGSRALVRGRMASFVTARPPREVVALGLAAHPK